MVKCRYCKYNHSPIELCACASTAVKKIIQINVILRLKRNFVVISSVHQDHSFGRQCKVFC